MVCTWVVCHGVSLCHVVCGLLDDIPPSPGEGLAMALAPPCSGGFRNVLPPPHPRIVLLKLQNLLQQNLNPRSSRGLYVYHSNIYSSIMTAIFWPITPNQVVCLKPPLGGGISLVTCRRGVIVCTCMLGCVVVWCVHVGLRVMACHCKSHVYFYHRSSRGIAFHPQSQNIDSLLCDC